MFCSRCGTQLPMHNDVLINIRWNRVTGKLETKAQGAALL